MSKIKAVLFDLDGTLLNTLDDLADAVNYFLTTHNYPTVSRQTVRRYLGNGAADLVRRSLPEAVDEETFAKYVKEYTEYYGAHSTIRTKPYDGVLGVLRELRNKGIVTAVVSNKPDPTVRQLCHRYFGELVDFSVGDRPDIQRKPSADPVIFAMNELGCDRAVFVGDSEVDVLTAANAGMPCVSLTWGFRDRDVLEESGARYFADDADQLKNQILSLIAEED